MPASLDPEREKLLIRRSDSDPDSFRELYHHYFPRVYGYVAHRVGAVEDTQDLVSEVFLKAIEKLDTFEYRGEGSFAAWLFRLAHNLVSDFYRRRQRQGEALHLEVAPNIADEDLCPDEAALQREDFVRLREMVATLSPQRQEVIRLKFFAGLRNREIAQILGLDERAVASHLCRGLEDLQRRFTGSLTGTRKGTYYESV